MATTNREVSIQIQEKFEFYLIALVFTVLGLSIQTAVFRQYIAADIAELLGWGLLLLSGIVGLKRLEMFPVLYRNYAIIHDWEREKTELVNTRALGQAGLDSRIEKLDGSIKKAEAKLTREEDKVRSRYNWHKRSFFFGVSLVATARATPAVDGIFQYFL